MEDEDVMPRVGFLDGEVQYELFASNFDVLSLGFVTVETRVEGRTRLRKKRVYSDQDDDDIFVISTDCVLIPSANLDSHLFLPLVILIL